MAMENKIVSNKALFTDLKGWWAMFGKCLVGLWNGLIWLLVIIVTGIFALFANVGEFLYKYCIKYPIVALTIVNAFWVIFYAATFVDISSRAKTYEYQRDSIGYEMLRIEQAIKGDTIIIGAANERTLKLYNAVKRAKRNV